MHILTDDTGAALGITSCMGWGCGGGGGQNGIIKIGGLGVTHRYGITTGFGAMAGVRVKKEDVSTLQEVRGHSRYRPIYQLRRPAALCSICGVRHLAQPRLGPSLVHHHRQRHLCCSLPSPVRIAWCSLLPAVASYPSRTTRSLQTNHSHPLRTSLPPPRFLIRSLYFPFSPPVAANGSRTRNLHNSTPRQSQQLPHGPQTHGCASMRSRTYAVSYRRTSLRATQLGWGNHSARP